MFLLFNIIGTLFYILRLYIIIILNMIKLKGRCIMFLKSKNLSFIIIGTSLLVSTSIIAAPMLKEIKAYLNPSIQYTLDGESILESTQTISYNNRNYVSVADLANALGLEVSYKNNTVSFTSPKEDVVTVPQATIKEILPDSNQIVILPAGAEDTSAHYLILNINSETTIKDTESAHTYTLKDLKEGMTLSVEHSPMMTRSLPPQTAAYTITLLEKKPTSVIEDENFPNSTLLTNMSIVSINADENYFIIAPKGENQADLNNQTIIRYSKDTLINGKANQNISVSLQVGNLVTVKVGPAATLSIPPQMLALEITLEA